MVQSPQPAIVEPLEVEALDAGVIEEARARQRRHRGAAAAATVAAAGIAAILWASVGGGGSARAGQGSAHPGRPAGTTARASLAACSQAKSLIEGAPSKSLLSMLGVLRRPVTPADALPQRIADAILLPSGFQVYAKYIRRARVVGDRTYYVMPARFAACAPLQRHDGVELACVLRVQQRIVDTGASGGSTATEIKQRGMFMVGGSCLHTAQATLIAGVVPDGVATVTLRYPASTFTTTPVNNIVVANVPHAGVPLDRPLTMTWRAANGTIIKTVTGGL